LGAIRGAHRQIDRQSDDNKCQNDVFFFYFHFTIPLDAIFFIFNNTTLEINGSKVQGSGFGLTQVQGFVPLAGNSLLQALHPCTLNR
jgi:hypothetical protein